MDRRANGPPSSESDDIVVVHVERDGGACRSCGSESVVRIRVWEEDSPLWVSLCADCDEHAWSFG
jgi:hypothetical protein